MADREIILSGFNRHTKEQWLYSLNVRSGKIQKLSSGPYIFSNDYNPYYPLCKVSSLNGHHHAIIRQSSSEYPNYYYTRDFVSFSPITSFAPHEKYVWYSNELHQWQLPDGQGTQEILYKPDNFDPEQRYPVIIHFYDNITDNLNKYLGAELSSGAMEIPYLFSKDRKSVG